MSQFSGPIDPITASAVQGLGQVSLNLNAGADRALQAQTVSLQAQLEKERLERASKEAADRIKAEADRQKEALAAADKQQDKGIAADQAFQNQRLAFEEQQRQRDRQAEVEARKAAEAFAMKQVEDARVYAEEQTLLSLTAQQNAIEKNAATFGPKKEELQTQLRDATTNAGIAMSVAGKTREEAIPLAQQMLEQVEQQRSLVEQWEASSSSQMGMSFVGFFREVALDGGFRNLAGDGTSPESQGKIGRFIDEAKKNTFDYLGSLFVGSKEMAKESYDPKFGATRFVDGMSRQMLKEGLFQNETQRKAFSDIASVMMAGDSVSPEVRDQQIAAAIATAEANGFDRSKMSHVLTMMAKTASSLSSNFSKDALKAAMPEDVVAQLGELPAPSGEVQSRALSSVMDLVGRVDDFLVGKTEYLGMDSASLTMTSTKLQKLIGQLAGEEGSAPLGTAMYTEDDLRRAGVSEAAIQGYMLANKAALGAVEAKSKVDTFRQALDEVATQEREGGVGALEQIKTQRAGLEKMMERRKRSK